MEPLVALMTTVATQDEARLLAHAAVERRLAACVQIGAIESIYRWDGTLQREPEVRVLFKTTRRNATALEETILALHPYALPAVCVFDIAQVNAPYARWVADSTSA